MMVIIIVVELQGGPYQGAEFAANEQPWRRFWEGIKSACAAHPELQQLFAVLLPVAFHLITDEGFEAGAAAVAITGIAGVFRVDDFAGQQLPR